MEEAHGLWDFILTSSENEEEEEALLVSMRSKGLVDTPIVNQNQKSLTPPAKEKSIVKNTSTPPSSFDRTTYKPSSSCKTLIVSDTIEYNILEDMKKVKDNIFLYEFSKLKQWHKF